MDALALRELCDECIRLQHKLDLCNLSTEDRQQVLHELAAVLKAMRALLA